MSTSQFNENCFRAMMMPYEKDYQTYTKTGTVSEYLKTFLVTDYVRQVSQAEPILAYPTDNQHITSVGTYYNGKQTPADRIENTMWRDMLVSQLYPATLRFPKFQETGSGIEFAPKNVGTVYLDYFRTPKRPVWGYTPVNNRPVFSQALSTDMEIDEFAFNNVSAYFFSFVGVNLSDANIAAFATAFKQETNMIL